MTRRWVAGLAIASALLGGSAARARAEDEAEKTWRSMSEAERQELRRRHDVFSKLRPEEQAEIKRRLKLFLALAPAERERLRELHRQYSRLEAGERRRIGELFRRYQHLPEARRAKLRLLMERVLKLPRGERERFLKNAATWRRLDPAQKQRLKQLFKLRRATHGP